MNRMLENHVRVRERRETRLAWTVYNSKLSCCVGSSPLFNSNSLITCWSWLVLSSLIDKQFFLYMHAAISTVVTVAEILKNNGFAVEKKIRTLTVDMRDEPGARPIPKAKIEVVMGKAEKFDELMAAEAEQTGDEE